jgi:hypothetical protein
MADTILNLIHPETAEPPTETQPSYPPINWNRKAANQLLPRYCSPDWQRLQIQGLETVHRQSFVWRGDQGSRGLALRMKHH